MWLASHDHIYLEESVDMKVLDAVSLFLLFKESEGLSPQTIKWYDGLLAQFCRSMEGQTVEQISAVTIALWLTEERGRGLSASSIEARYRALQAFFNWCEGTEEVGRPASPIGHRDSRRVKRPKVGDRGVRYVRYAQYVQVTGAIDLANWLDYRDWCLLGLLYWCGLRRAELCGLAVDDVDFTQRLVLVQHGKGDKARIVPVTDEVVGGIATYLSIRPRWPGPELWLSDGFDHRSVRGPLSPTGLRLMLERRCRAAGVEYLRPHRWRHGFAMSVLNAGAEMSSVSAMMGHSSVQVTERVYARWLVDGLRREYDAAVARIREGR
jgi:integrase/recombinase XerC